MICLNFLNDLAHEVHWPRIQGLPYCDQGFVNTTVLMMTDFWSKAKERKNKKRNDNEF